MSTSQTTDPTAAAASTEQAPARKARRWPWIVAIAAVAALGATGTGVATASAASAQQELSVLPEDYIDLETRAGIAQSSLELIREHRDRLELELEAQTAELEALQAQVGEPEAAQQG